MTEESSIPGDTNKTKALILEAVGIVAKYEHFLNAPKETDWDNMPEKMREIDRLL